MDRHKNVIKATLIDYGLAKWIGEKVALERVGTTTPIDYRSPEGKANNFTNEAHDTFAFAVLLSEIVWNVRHHPSDPRVAEVVRVIRRGLEFDPFKRATTEWIVLECERILASSSPRK